MFYLCEGGGVRDDEGGIMPRGIYEDVLKTVYTNVGFKNN